MRGEIIVIAPPNTPFNLGGLNRSVSDIPGWSAGTGSGALGLMPGLPNFYQRIHGPAINRDIGAGCVLMASMAYFKPALQSRPVIHEGVISLFILKTAPVVAKC